MRLAGHLHLRGVILELEDKFRVKYALPAKSTRQEVWVKALGKEPALVTSLSACTRWKGTPVGSSSVEEGLAKMVVAIYGRASAKAHPVGMGPLPTFEDGTEGEKCFVRHLCEHLGVDAAKVQQGEEELKAME